MADRTDGPGDAGSAPPSDQGEMALEALCRLLDGRNAVVLSGAGCSTESGIPDYRGEGRRRRTRSPILFQEFMGDPQARARYWLRSTAGWPRFSAARPNSGHRAVAKLEELGVVRGVITQNVDGLHQGGGSRRVLELHGSLDRVCCMACRGVEDRGTLQERLVQLNPDLESAWAAPAPDGDAHVNPEPRRPFQVPECRRCRGILKPDVVFFGENVPRDRLKQAWSLYEKGDVLLVLGSSLAVFSGRRFILRAAKDGRPVAIVNQGPTRCDDAARVRVEGRLGTVLPRLARLLSHGSSQPPLARGA